MVGDGVGPARRGGGGGGGVTPGRMETQARRVARQMTVDFVTINYDGVSGGEDDSSISSSSRYVMFSSLIIITTEQLHISDLPAPPSLTVLAQTGP